MSWFRDLVIEPANGSHFRQPTNGNSVVSTAVALAMAETTETNPTELSDLPQLAPNPSEAELLEYAASASRRADSFEGLSRQGNFREANQ